MKNQKIRNLRNYTILGLCIMIIIMGGTSCRQSEVYSQFSEVKNGEWDREETFYFELDSTLFELDQPYDITLELTNNTNYPYRNIWFYVTHNLYSIDKDTHLHLEYFLADEEGRWFGGGFGALYQTSLVFKRNYRFTEKRNYVFGISQDMIDNPLNGIERVGLNLTKVQ